MIRDDASGKTATTCTIITTESDGLVLPPHDRMPVILRTEHEWNRL